MWLARNAKHLSQSEAAHRANISEQQISKWERNAKEINVAALKILSDVYQCSMDWFFEEVPKFAAEGLAYAKITKKRPPWTLEKKGQIPRFILDLEYH